MPFLTIKTGNLNAIIWITFILDKFSFLKYLLGDRKLMQALVFDARVTEWFSKPNSSTSNARDDKG